MTQKILCIYHADCNDGFAAAWAVHQRLGDTAEYLPAAYHEAPPGVAGRDVIIVDFSYGRRQLDAMAAEAHSIVILDHHKTAKDDLAGLYAPPVWEAWRSGFGGPPMSAAVRCTALFDMTRSGAGIAWDYFHHHHVDRPRFINYVEDRDLWKKELPNTEEFTFALSSYPKTFEVWDELARDAGVDMLLEEGVAIRRYYRLRIEDFKRDAYPATIGGVACTIANAHGFAASDLGGELAEHTGLGATYHEVAPRLYKYSLRSRGGFDCQELAKRFGGGGHPGAAGFTHRGHAHVAVP